MASDPGQILDLAERLASVAHHVFDSDVSGSPDRLVAGFVRALERLTADGLTMDEAYQEIFSRLSDGVADG